MADNQEYLVTVCKSCRRASCWHDDQPCYRAHSADIEQVKRTVLDAEAREHPSWYSEQRLMDVCGHVEYVQ